MYFEGNLELTVKSELMPEGSCLIHILHPEGRFQFHVPKEERDTMRAEQRRERLGSEVAPGGSGGESGTGDPDPSR